MSVLVATIAHALDAHHGLGLHLAAIAVCVAAAASFVREGLR